MLTPNTQLPTANRQSPIALTKAAMLLALGIYFVWVIASGSLANYINERFAWLSYLAAAVFLLLGVWNLVFILRGSSSERDHHGDTLSWGTLAIVAIPLVLGTLVPSRPLGAEAVGGSIAITNAAAAANVSQFTIDPLKRNVLDWLRVFNSVTDFSELDGEQADLIGFVYREPTFDDDQFMIARYSISCCVADASALGVPAAWADTATLEQGQWVRVQGAFQTGSFRDNLLPILQVASIEPIEQPEHPYLYP